MTYCFTGIVALFLVYLVPYFLNNEIELLLKNNIFLGTTSAIIFYHTNLYFHSTERNKKVFRKIDYSFLLFTVIIATALTVYNKNFEIAISSQLESEYKDLEEVIANTPFSFKIPSNLPNNMKFESGRILNNSGKSIVEIAYGNNHSEVSMWFYASEYFIENEVDYQNEVSINQNDGTIGYIFYIDDNNKEIKVVHVDWKEDSIYYSITSSVLSEEELIKIAESLRLLESRFRIDYQYLCMMCPIQPKKNILLNKFLFSFDFQLFISCNLFVRRNHNCVIKVEHCRDYFGFLLEFDERGLIKVHNTETLNKLTQSIVDFISILFLYSKFDYAFCHHESEIKYSPECIKIIDEEFYSLLIVPKLDRGEEKLQIFLSSWHIDEHTTRAAKKRGLNNLIREFLIQKSSKFYIVTQREKSILYN